MAVDILNQILYYKRLYDSQPTNRSLKDYAHSSALKEYQKLDSSLSSAVQNMNADSLANYINSRYQQEQTQQRIVQQNQMQEFEVGQEVGQGEGKIIKYALLIVGGFLLLK